MKTYLLLITILFGYFGFAQYTAIPDANFENALSAYDDIPNDGQVPTANINAVTNLNISSQNITDLTGIEDFIVLEQLVCNDNQLVTVDFSNNVFLFLIFCHDNQLINLDVSSNIALTVLVCTNNQLTYLNVKNGNNTNINNNNFASHNNPNLTCIEVDNVTYSTSNWQNIDPASTFVNNQTECNALIDTDGDGLTDADETNIYNTDPNDADTDDDGLSDGQELNTVITNPLDADTDGDNIFDGTEYGIVNPLPDTDTNVGNFIADADLGVTITDPNNPDTDGDNLFDGAEDSNHDGETIYTLGFTGTTGSGETDPNSDDTDGDGLVDGDEVNVYGSDPLDVDTDDGGIADGIEVIIYFTNPIDPNDDDYDGDGFTITTGDCDDNDASIYPGATEYCDGIDNNCDGNIDENAVDATMYYADIDGDGFGDPSNTILSCNQPANYISDNTDCDDNDASVYPGATDIPNNGIDEDCDGQDATALIEDEIFNKKLSIYPNPTKNKVTIKTDRLSNYKIFNIGGQIIQKGNLSEGENILDIQNFSNGVYFIKINSDKNSAVLKLIKK